VALCCAVHAEPVALETAHDASEPAETAGTAGTAQPILAAEGGPAGRPPELLSAIDLGSGGVDESWLTGHPDVVLLELLRVARQSEGVSKTRMGVPMKTSRLAGPSVARPTLPDDDRAEDFLRDGLFDALAPSEQLPGFISDARDWYRGIGPNTGAEGRLGQPVDAAGMTEGGRGDERARERLVLPVIHFLRENRVWIFGSCLACALLVPAFDVKRRSGRGASRRRPAAERRLQQERRAPIAGSGAAERRTAGARRSGPDRRLPPRPAAR
jgi:hypothetical protein